jgi:citrate synthase
MDRADPAWGRLAVLSSHLLSGGAGAGEAAGLERSPVSAAAPGPRAGALAVVDGRTGKRYEVKVSEDGTVRATDFKKVLSSQRGLTVPAVAPCRDPRGVLAF